MDSFTEEEATFLDGLENRLNEALIFEEQDSVVTRELRDEERPFVFFEVSEIDKFTKDTIPKAKRLKSCGIVQYDDNATYLHQPSGKSDDNEFYLIELVDTELLSELPQPRRLIEIFGYVRLEGTDGQIKFSVWFWRERLGNYNALVALYKELRERFCE